MRTTPPTPCPARAAASRLATGACPATPASGHSLSWSPATTRRRCSRSLRRAMIDAVYINPPVPAWEGFPMVEPLRKRHAAEVLAFLAERPLHTIGMAGYIRENGVESPLNRGTFYAARNALGRLE